MANCQDVKVSPPQPRYLLKEESTPECSLNGRLKCFTENAWTRKKRIVWTETKKRKCLIKVICRRGKNTRDWKRDRQIDRHHRKRNTGHLNYFCLHSIPHQDINLTPRRSSHPKSSTRRTRLRCGWSGVGEGSGKRRGAEEVAKLGEWTGTGWRDERDAAVVQHCHSRLFNSQ